MASLEILEQVGLRIKSKTILNIFKDSGSEVNYHDNNVKIPEYLVVEAIKKAPSKIILSGRNPDLDILVEGRRIYYVLGGSPVPYMIDIESGEWIKPTRKHVGLATKLGDALPNMDVIMSLGGAHDVPYQLSWIYELATIFNNTEKPIIYSVAGMTGAKMTLDMAAAITGSYEDLRKKHILSLFSSFLTPLCMDAQHENIVEYAKLNTPIVCGSGLMPGASTPITVAGASVIGNAEFLCAATLAELVNPGTPLMYCSEAGNIDVRTGVALYSHPEKELNFVIGCQLAEFYGVPTFGAGATTDAKCIDTQAGLEAMGTAILSALGGVNLIHNCGTIASGAAGSLEMAVIADEIANYVNRILRGVQVTDDTLAVDVIRKVGPGGHFLSQKHTRKYLQEGEFWLSDLLNRETEIKWKEGESKPLAIVARERVKRLLKEHCPTPLSDDTQNKINKILKRAEKELVR